MSENLKTEATAGASETDAYNAQAGSPHTSKNAYGDNTTRATRQPNRNGTFQSSANKDFQGATPKLAAILVLRNETVTRKVNYDRFLEKLGIYIVNELKDGDYVIEVTKNPKAKIIDDFMTNNKPTELSDDEKNRLWTWKYTRKRSRSM